MQKPGTGQPPVWSTQHSAVAADRGSRRYPRHRRAAHGGEGAWVRYWQDVSESGSGTAAGA